MPDIFVGVDRRLLVAAAAVVILVAGWIVTMVAVLFRAKLQAREVARREIALAALSLAVAASLVYLGHVSRRVASPEVAVEAPSVATGGTGTCASVREGMRADEVTRLLGTPSMELSAEDALGPGARVLVFEASRCAVHLVRDVVEHVE